MATPVFRWCPRPGHHQCLETVPVSIPLVRWICMTVGPVKFPPEGHRRLHLHAEAAPPWWMTRSTPGPLARTAWSPNSRWAVKPSSVVSASGRWKSGHWKLTVRPTRSKKCSRLNPMTFLAGPRSTKPLSAAKTRFEAGIPESFNVLVKELRSLGLNVELEQSEF